ncbi:IS30 family transposase [uncultured Veillonella sp.]|uniref:IS30 family transposase n=1 Tax=uncultured Veillonella sp. TaxID=159268 RepID=UPI00260EBDF7|nr:IS30 family transposase [uncultured Veillonella sp.]
MDYIKHNTTLRTNKHLNLEERFYVEKRIAAGDSVTAIATVLGCSRTTIYTELKRGSVVQIRQGKACIVYIADSGQLTYEQQRLGSFNTMKLGFIESFILWVEEKVFKDHWSFDAAVGYAKRQCIFARNEMVCTKTLYNYIHQGLLGVKAIDLPLVVRRSMRKSIVRKHKRKSGQSIELRDATIETRKEFGHWELDTVRGTKNKTDNVLVTLLERKSRLYVALRCPSARACDVKETLEAWLTTFRKNVELGTICKTITADNGLEFADISELEDEILSIYFAHPYSAWERGSNERHNGLFRRFIPKGQRIENVSADTLQRALHWCNNLPRKILHYKTPQEAFLEEVNKIVDLSTVQFHIAI